MAKPKKRWQNIKLNLLPISLSVLLFILTIFTYQVMMVDKYYPLTSVGDTNISFLTEGQALRLVQASFQKRAQQKLTFDSFTIDLATSSANLDYSSLSLVFNNSHSGTWAEQLTLQLQALFSPIKIYPKVSLSLDKQIDTIASAVDQAPQNAQLIYDETTTEEGTPSSRIQIKEGKDGLTLDRLSVEKAVADYLLFGKYQSVLPTTVVPPKITTARVLRAKEALENSQTEPVKLVFAGRIWTIDTKQLLTLLDLTQGEDLLLDQDKTDLYLGKVASEIDQPVQEGLFEFNLQTKRVASFKPSQEGRKLAIDKTYQLISDAFLGKIPKNINLPVSIIKPKIQTSDVNSLGIKELIGRGVSNFARSISNRIYNIQLTASKINGVLVPPGEVFSFNQTVGDMTAANGFKQGYVIKEGRTVLDDGGGVCQDSTTLFRAVLNAGLPIVKRTAHAYRVGYYEQGFPPGLDATVFYPSVDFQFKNDTPAHILIQAYTVETTLYFDLYGTSDGRITTISKSVVTDQIPPPSELRQDDPTLPKGTVKQVDWAAWGAKVSFKRTVSRGGEEIIKETWNSTYKPWQAVYLVGTQ